MRGVLILHADHAAHLGASLAALEAGEPAFLGNPKWAERSMDEALRQVPAGCRVEGAETKPRGMGTCDWPLGWRGRLMIPTGGTGGTVKFAIHDGASLRGAARSLAAALELRGMSPRIHGASLTPPWHVSGLMPAIRARETGGVWQVMDGRFAPGAPLPGIALPRDGTRVASLVPAQLDRLLARADGEAWLRGFDVILLGGSAVPAPLLAAARERRLPVALTYGMTETAAAVALAWPEDWADGAPAGHPLPGVTFSAAGGRIRVSAPGLCRGHWPASPMAAPFDTGDLGEVLADGRVRITGRADRLIATGGEKVDPARVEAALVATGLAKAAHVLGMPDVTWGRLMVAVVVAEPACEAALRASMETVLEPAARPRRYLFVDELPFDARGKLDPGSLGRLLA
jgi:o-succinylbenzoate---CoA ligase